MRTRSMIFTLALLILTIVYASRLSHLISFSRQEGYGSYIVVAPAIAAYLIWTSRQKIFTSVAFSSVSASITAICALLSFFSAIRYHSALSENDYLSLTALSFCLFVTAIFLASFGQKAFRAALFPAFMLFFFVPLPAELTARIVALLQAGSATLVYWIFSILQVPVLREGLVFTVPGVSIEIAAECSGINSSMALLITSLLVADASFRRISSKIIFVLTSLPLSILKNAIRIVTLTMLATHVDMGFLTGKLHQRGGFLFFLLTLALMIPVWKLLLNREEALFSKAHLLSAAGGATSSL